MPTANLPRGPYGRAGNILSLTAILALTACSVPNHMHVTEGISPKNIDMNVRFRATYYFRVFDYCWQANVPLQGGTLYRSIIPETDSVYRYIMTGKASALGSKIRFESGTIDANDIDPFGSDVVYDPDLGAYRRRSKEDAAEEAKAARAARLGKEEQAGALARFQTLADLYGKLPSDVDADKKAALKKAMDDALAAYTGLLKAPVPDDVAARFDKVDTDIAALGKTVSGLKVTTTGSTDAEALAKAAGTAAAEGVKKDILDAVTPKVANAKALDEMCPANSIRKRGFQLMGPEGMQEFDQDKRLILAMHTSAKPLTETLTEYAARVTNGRVTPSERLLPLVQENLRAQEAEHELDQIALDAATGKSKPAIADIVKRTLDAFGTEERP